MGPIGCPEFGNELPP